MESFEPELLVELLTLAVYVAAAFVLTVVGALAEYSSVQHLVSGEGTVALWMAAVGALFLYAGVYGIAYQKVLERVRG